MDTTELKVHNSWDGHITCQFCCYIYIISLAIQQSDCESTTITMQFLPVSPADGVRIDVTKSPICNFHETIFGFMGQTLIK